MTALADELPIEDIFAVDHDIVPFERADVFQQEEIDPIGERVALTQDPGDFAPLPVDDARQDQVAPACARCDRHARLEIAACRPWPADAFRSIVTDQRNTAATRHIEGAHLAIAAFQRGMRDPANFQSSVVEPICLSLLGAMMLRTGWDTDPGIISKPYLVVRAHVSEHHP